MWDNLAGILEDMAEAIGRLPQPQLKVLQPKWESLKHDMEDGDVETFLKKILAIAEQIPMLNGNEFPTVLRGSVLRHHQRGSALPLKDVDYNFTSVRNQVTSIHFLIGSRLQN